MDAYLKIIRPNVCFLAASGVFVGAIVSRTIDPLQIFLAVLAAFFVCASGNVINDYFDIEIDRINRPKRPLPSGNIKPENAIIYYLTLSVLGIGLSLFVSPAFFVVAVLSFFVSTVYAWKLKKIAIVGNMTDSFLASATFLSGGLIAGTFQYLWKSPVFILAVIAFLTNMGREIFKDTQDIKGDRALSAKTLPVLIGESFSMDIGRIFVIAGALSALWPYKAMMFGDNYLLSVLPCIFVLFYSVTLANPKKAQNVVKTGMFLGIFAFLVGAFFG